MSKPLIMKKKAKVVALIIFLLGLGILTFTQNWWPGIMVVIGLPLAIWQYLQGRLYDMAITLFVFIGAFATVQFNIQWQILLPVLFTVGGIYIFFREWLESRSNGSDPTDSLDEEDK